MERWASGVGVWTDRKDDADEGLPELLSRELKFAGRYAEGGRVGRYDDDDDGGWGERDPKE